MTDMDYRLGSKLLGFEDVDAEFVKAFQNRENFYSVWNEKDLAGVLQVEEGDKAYLNVYINTPCRGRGIGDAALNLGEQILRDTGADKIMTAYRLDHCASKSFAEKHGYTRCFSSVYMEYSGNSFEMPFLSIREYTDDDYQSAHELYARAFHKMRVRVGDFLDSVVEQPNDSMREQWALTKKERLVYTQGSEIIGYAHVVGNEIGSISIRPEYQGQGFGRMFAKHIVNKALDRGYATVSLYCVVGNWAKRLYDSLGFRDTYTVEYAIKSVH